MYESLPWCTLLALDARNRLNEDAAVFVWYPLRCRFRRPQRRVEHRVGNCCDNWLRLITDLISPVLPHFILPMICLHQNLSVRLRGTASQSGVQLRSQSPNTPRPVEGSCPVSTTSLAANSGSPVSAMANQYNSSISVRVCVSLCDAASRFEIRRLFVWLRCRGVISGFLLEVQRGFARYSVRILGHSCHFRCLDGEDLAVSSRSAGAGVRKHRWSRLIQR